MSESDDTDLLLLIPPDYFILTAEQKLQQKQKMQSADQAATAATAIDLGSITPTLPPTTTTAAYEFLAADRKAELNEINSRLYALEMEDGAPFLAPSDISTISNAPMSTQFSQLNRNVRRDSSAYMHSTPVKSKYGTRTNDGQDDVLLEIDNFLQASNWSQYNKVVNDGVAPLGDEMLQNTIKNNNNLISLSEIWGRDGAGNQTTLQPALKEEQLRRQHLEKIVRQMQIRLLEYQQRLSVAIEVDREKDAALHAAEQENKSLNAELQRLRDAMQSLESEKKDYMCKLELLQTELAQAVSLATKFEEKNERLEAELASSARKTNDSHEIYKQKIVELELKLQASQRTEQFSVEELSKFKDKYAKIEYQYEKFKTRCDDLEEESSKLRQQKETLQEFHQKQKNRADSLDSQLKSLQDTLDSLTDSEASLRKKLDSQQKSLKLNYQQQLEKMVAQKHKEFQAQLDKMEEQLKTAAQERERLIAERAVKQVELINEKNEEEFILLQEKHNEEVELYRIQLANAAKRIEQLDAKLNGYKSKRADIAEKLHDVMETQWQKALEILTSPNPSRHSTQQYTSDASESSPEQHQQAACCKQNNHFETPKTSRAASNHGGANGKTKENNLNNCTNSKEAAPVDRLQAYIDLLLSKSPSDIEKLEEILALTTKSKHANTSKLNKSKRINGKPPWKA